jgi:Flp pilus assembly protein TadG
MRHRNRSFLVLPQNSETATQRDERGAAAVETALILPLFVLLIFGIIEVGSMFLNLSAVRNASRDAARQASASASSPTADQEALAAAGKSLSALVGSLEGIIIFKANNINDHVPSNCVTALHTGAAVVGPNHCNIYHADQVRNPDITNFGAATVGGPFWDGNWPAQLRNDSLSTTQTPDLVGVYVELRHAGATGLLPKRTIRSLNIFQLEPQRSIE